MAPHFAAGANDPAGGGARDGRVVGADGAATFPLPVRPRPGGDPPDPKPIPNPHPYPPPARPGLSWLPALMLPSLLLLAAVDYTAWAAWWI